MSVREQQRVTQVLLDRGASSAASLVEDGRVISFDMLRRAVDERVSELELPPRSLVVVETANAAASVVSYLALLAGGHVPLLAGRHAETLADHWRADAVVTADATLHRRHAVARPNHVLHPDLAVLMSTSGSTGAPKLVRLSHDNLTSNALAVGASLGLTDADRGVTTLPLHYCYGLSVLHSHLAVGASLVLTDASVLDPCFVRAMQEGVTNVAGVPHTFELLERSTPERIRVSSLRLVTQAGGRLSPDRVAAWTTRLRSWGAEFVVMYGQTEATARMAVLPPALAVRHPEAVGRAIAGGSFEVRPVDGSPADVGELIYRGPNVMLGYAESSDDLAAGRTVHELATGDLARAVPGTDLVEIVGRRARFVKPFGLRIDLGAVEEHLRSAGIDAVVTGDDEHLVVGAPDADPQRVLDLVLGLTSLPASAVHVDLGPIPRTDAGKVDLHALHQRAVLRAPPTLATSSVADAYRRVLGDRAVAPTSTFVSLGGDSLSYVECSARLEERLGRLPTDWHLRTVAELDALVPGAGRPRIDTTVVLRAIGIAAIVSTHMSLWFVPGGAHLMLAVVGFNVSRFQLSLGSTRERVRSMARTLARIAVPVVVLVGTCMVTVGGYGLPTLTLTNNYLGPFRHLEGRWHFWFIEAVVQIVVVVTIVLAIPAVRRFERRHPYVVALLFVGVAVLFRYRYLEVGGGNLRFRTHGVAWFFALGWLTHRSTTDVTRLATMAIVVVAIPGFFTHTSRGVFIAVGIVVLLWCRDVPLPRPMIRAVSTLAAASMWIYISHFRVWPVLDRNLPTGIAYVTTLAAGIGIWWAVERLTALVRHRSNWSIRVRAPARPVAVAAD